MAGVLAITVLVAFLVPHRNAGLADQNPASAANPPTFEESIAPILKVNCSPCHFEGGKVFDKYPFAKYETVRDLGKKLNTRLKGDNADLVLSWIKAGSPEKENTREKE